jgi:hypothetical protein
MVEDHEGPITHGPRSERLRRALRGSGGAVSDLNRRQRSPALALAHEAGKTPRALRDRTGGRQGGPDSEKPRPASRGPSANHQPAPDALGACSSSYPESCRVLRLVPAVRRPCPRGVEGRIRMACRHPQRYPAAATPYRDARQRRTAEPSVRAHVDPSYRLDRFARPGGPPRYVHPALPALARLSGGAPLLPRRPARTDSHHLDPAAWAPRCLVDPVARVVLIPRTPLPPVRPQMLPASTSAHGGTSRLSGGISTPAAAATAN